MVVKTVNVLNIESKKLIAERIAFNIYLLVVQISELRRQKWFLHKQPIGFCTRKGTCGYSIKKILHMISFV